MGCSQSVPVETSSKPVAEGGLASPKALAGGKPPSGASKKGSKPPIHPGRSAKGLAGSDGSSASATQRETSDSDANHTTNNRGRFASYASGASTPEDDRSEDDMSVGSSEGSGTRGSGSGLRKSDKKLVHSTSAIGLDEMIEDRREGGDLRENVVHIEVPFGKPIEEVYEGVHNGPVLGSGISGLVRLVTHRSTGIKYAVKVLDLGLVDNEEGLKQLREEIFIMCQLDHPNIVRLEEVYESHSEIYLVQELCLGGELFDRLDEQPDYHYTEAECARLVKQMLSAVRYLHTKGIIHRDLKLENFLFSTSSSTDSELKMIDFGLSKHFRYGEVHHEAVGTPYTVSPEVIRGSYDERCDVWAIGVISFLLLSGEPPFGGCGGPEPLMQVRSNILKGSYRFEPAEIWDTVSRPAKDFIKALLVTDPKKRPTARAAQKHKWLQEWASRSRQVDDHVLNPNVVKALVNFKEFSDMRKLLCEVLSFTLLPEQIKDLRSEFEKMDTDGSGEISLGALKQVLMTNAGAGSLGALTEEEVEDIFNAMRVRKTDTRIRWHEFIAAGLSQCQVDDRNLRLAFDRLDSDHKGYITLDDIMDLMGNNTMHTEEAFERMWGDSIKAVKCQQQARITYGDFLLLMKGQTKEAPSQELDRELKTNASTLLALNARSNLGVVQEAPGESEEKNSPEHLITLPSGDEVTSDGVIREATGGRLSLSLQNITEGVPLETVTEGEPISLPFRTSAPPPSGTQSAPNTPTGQRHMISISEDMDSPVSMGEGFGVHGQSLTPPETPERGARDYVTPCSEDRYTVNLPDNVDGIMVPGLPIARPDPYKRGRSKSLGGDDQINNASNSNMSVEAKDAPSDLHTLADHVLDMIVPEAHHHAATGPSDLDNLVKDESKTNLVVNRKLYRAHRQLRLSVLEASKRFEEQQAAHARDVLLAQSEAEGNSNDANGKQVIHAGLVMRHGEKKHISSEAIRTLLKENQRQQQALVEKFSKRGGRGKRIRKKTVSDMAGMLSSMGQDELGSIASRAMASEELQEPPALQESASASEVLSSLQPPDEVEGQIRHATVPGEFRKTYDPFSRVGKYGAVAAWDSAYPEPN